MNPAKGLGARRNAEGIGRSPFARPDRKAPWHGGDSVWPAVPYRFANGFWTSEFGPGDFPAPPNAGAGDAADLLERMRHGAPLEELARRLPGAGGAAKSAGGAFRTIPLPAAFGPHALMRLAGLSGGRYVLWSWNPTGRAKVQYDFARCHAYAPSLASRRRARKDATANRHHKACLRAWHLLLEMGGDIVAQDAPLTPNLAAPQPMDAVEPSGTFALSWREKAAWRDFLLTAENAMDVLDDAARLLDRALEKAPAERPGARRAFADARLLRHIVRVARFEAGEAFRVASRLDPAVFDDDATTHGIRPVPWIERGRDPDGIRTTAARPRDEQRARTVLAARRQMLDRYRGTPFGEQVALNEVQTFEPTTRPRIDLSGLPGSGGSGRSPSESNGPRPTSPPPRPGGGSSGSGPSSGG